VVVELVVDPAVDGTRWRHPATYVRLRPDLHPTDLHPAGPPSAPSRTGPAERADNRAGGDEPVGDEAEVS